MGGVLRRNEMRGSGRQGTERREGGRKREEGKGVGIFKFP